MTLQQKTLRRYRTLFPSEQLRVTSARTGIQITRVFRLFNGKTMKVGELEAFQRVINEKMSESPNLNKLQTIIDEASSILTDSELNKLTNYVERKVKARSYGRLYVTSNSESASIA